MVGGVWAGVVRDAKPGPDGVRVRSGRSPYWIIDVSIFLLFCGCSIGKCCFRGVFGGSAPQGAGWLAGGRLGGWANHTPWLVGGRASVHLAFVPGRCWPPFGLQAVVPGERGFLSVVVRVIPANSGLKLDVARVKQVREVVGLWPVSGPRPRRTKLAAGDALDGVDVAGRECVGADWAYGRVIQQDHGPPGVS